MKRSLAVLVLTVTLACNRPQPLDGLRKREVGRPQPRLLVFHDLLANGQAVHP